MSTFSGNNHYVPIWYQKEFLLPGQSQFKYYMDLRPDTKIINGRKIILRDKHIYGPKICFCEEDLYTTYFHGKMDLIEKKLFGSIDTNGAVSLPYVIDKDGICKRDPQEYIINFMNYLSAQKVRTPKVLELHKKIIQARIMKAYRRLPISEMLQNLLIDQICKFLDIHQTMLYESNWEIVSAESSSVKFILSDNPVTLYNPSIFPKNKRIDELYMFGIDLIGTKTIFPLGLNYCLIMTNRECLLDPAKKQLRQRTNARIFDQTIFNVLNIIRERELTSDEVCQINLIIKRYADRYIASAEPKWLMPESMTKTIYHPKLDKVLLPRKKHVKNFTFQCVGNNESMKGFDSLGRPVPQNILKQVKETFDRLKQDMTE